MVEHSSAEEIKIVTNSGLLKDQAPDIAEELSHDMRGLTEGLSGVLLGMGTDQRTVMLQVLRNLNNSIYAKGTEDGKDPQEVLVALRGANALLEPESQDQQGAEEMIAALKKRY